MLRLQTLLVLLLLAPCAPAAGFEEDIVYRGRSLRDWLADVRTGNEVARRRASRVLRLVGPEAGDAAPALLMALKLDDVTARERLAAALARMGPRQVPLLAAALSFDDDRLVCGAARALALLGPQARPAARHLRRQLTARAPLVRILCAGALLRSERDPDALAVLRKVLSSDSVNDCQWAAWSLAQCGPAATPAAAELVKLLGSRNDAVRHHALRALEALGRPAVEPLLAGLRSSSAGRRVECAEALGRLGPTADSAVIGLEALLEDLSPGPRASAARALGRIGLVNDGVLAALRKGVRDADRDVRLESAKALTALGPAARQALTDLRLLARDDHRGVRRAACQALAGTGKPAVPVLVELLGDADPLIRRQALEALQAVGPDAAAALPALASIARDPKDFLRVRAIAALGGLGKPAVETLSGLLGDGRVCIEAAAALARIGPDAAAACPALIQALRDPSPIFRTEVIRALAAIGPAARQALPALVKAYDDEQWRLVALDALARVDTPAKDLLPILRKGLKDPKLTVRLQSLALCPMLGPEARALIPDIAALVESASPIRPWAADALIVLDAAGSLGPRFKPLLGSRNAQQREFGLRLLGSLGARAKAQRDEVRRRLQDDEPAVRLAAAKALAEIDPEDTSAVPMLIEQIKGINLGAESSSLFRLLGRLGRRAPAVVPALADVVGHNPNPGVRLLATQALEQIGPAAREAAPALLGLLLDLERLVDLGSEEAIDAAALDRGAWKAAHALVVPDRSQEAERALDTLRGTNNTGPLLHVLRSARDFHQESVLRALVSIGPAVIPLATRDLGDELAERRILAARVLARLGPRARGSLDQLRQAARDGNPAVAVEAAAALHAVSGEVETVLPVLRRGLGEQGDTAVRAARALAALGTVARPAVPDLLAALTARDAVLRREALRALGACGADADRVRSPVEARLRDLVWPVRVAAAVALEPIDAGVDTVPVLVAALRHSKDSATRLEAIAALRRRKERTSGLAALSACLTDTDPRVRAAAAAVVRERAGDSPLVLDGLLFGAVLSGRPAEQVAALRALGKVQVGRRRALHILGTLAHDPAGDVAVRRAAREVLAGWGEVRP